MAADISDLLTPVALGTKTELAAPFTDGDSSMTCEDLSAWAAIAAESAVYFGVDRVELDNEGKLVRVDNSYTEWKGIVSGDTIGSLELIAGDAQDYPAGSGARVVMIITSAWANAIIQALLLTLNRDGTLKNAVVGEANIVNAAVGSDKIESQAVGFTKMDTDVWAWQVLGRTKLAAAGDTIAVPNLPARKYLRILVSVVPNGNITPYMRFNGDTGNTYAYRFDANNGSSVTNTPSTNAIVVIPGNTTVNGVSTIDVINVSTSEKLGSLISTDNGGTNGAATLPTRWEMSFKWANTSAPIDTVTLFNSVGTGDFGIDSEVIVLGRD